MDREGGGRLSRVWGETPSEAERLLRGGLSVGTEMELVRGRTSTNLPPALRVPDGGAASELVEEGGALR